jgi:hypothetical protein
MISALQNNLKGNIKMLNNNHIELTLVLTKLFNSKVTIINGYCIIDALVAQAIEESRGIFINKVTEIGQLVSDGIYCEIDPDTNNLITNKGYFYKKGNTWCYHKNKPASPLIKLMLSDIPLVTRRLTKEDFTSNPITVEMKVLNYNGDVIHTVPGVATLINGKVIYSIMSPLVARE